MQIKTIKKILSKKMEEWLESITDQQLRVRVKGSLLVTGGSIVSLLQNSEVNDYDIYLQDRNVLIDLVKYYTKSVPEANIWLGEEKKEIAYGYNGDLGDDNYFTCSLRNLKEDQVKIFIDGASNTGGMRFTPDPEAKYQLAFLSPNAISLTDDIQIIVRFFGTPAEIHRNFDFIHATNYFSFAEGVVLNLDAVTCILTNTLKYQGSLYPLTSVIRSKKFLKRGFNMSAGEYLKMMFQISLLDLTNLDVLEEQLIGVDVAYFSVLISALRNAKDGDPEFKIDSGYLIALIEKIFNDDSENEN